MATAVSYGRRCSPASGPLDRVGGTPDPKEAENAIADRLSDLITAPTG